MDTAREHESPAQRRFAGMRVGSCAGGVILLVVLVGITFGVLGLIPAAVGRVREPARRATCKSNLRCLGLACHMYADDSDGEFPTAEDWPSSIRLLWPAYVDNPKLFQCPSGARVAYRQFKDGAVHAGCSSYVYVPGLRADFPEHFVLAYEKLDNHRNKGTYENGWNVLYADAHVEWWTDYELEFQEMLKAQREAVKKWRAQGANALDISRALGGPETKDPR
jgi:prepilin-type processing-associated H-X9-DG protein